LIKPYRPFNNSTACMASTVFPELFPLLGSSLKHDEKKHVAKVKKTKIILFIYFK